MMQSKNHTIKRSFFLFVNTVSGSQLGKQLLNLQMSKIQFKIPFQKDGNKLELEGLVHFYSLKKERQQGFQQLKRRIVDGQKPIVVICGGDGTVMWVISEYDKYKIDPDSAPIAIIPLGTGNDFSRWLGWGAQKDKLVENNYQNLKQLLIKWQSATQEYLDVWDMRAETFSNGYFDKINKKGQSIRFQKTVLKRSFVNYFSFGIDGKVGYAFDQHRTNSRFGNFAMYACMSCWQSTKKTRQVKQLVSEMKVISEQTRDKIFAHSHQVIGKPKYGMSLNPDPKNQDELEQFRIEKEQSTRSRSRSREASEIEGQKIVFKTHFEQDQQNKQQSAQITNRSKAILQNSYCNVLALNIDSYAGGLNQVWENATNGINTEQDLKKYKQPSSQDHQIEFVCFKSASGIILERLFPGNASKITQGKGPFLFQFNKNISTLDYGTYLQLDGEFIRFSHPKNIVIQISKIVPQGRIRVLRNVMGRQRKRSFLIF